MTDAPGAGPASRLVAAWARGPVVLDAAHGTRLLARGLDLARDDPSAWNLDRPEAVLALHVLDVAAGADALLTNTFGANAAWLARTGRARDARAINRAGVALAREAAGPDRPVLGSIGPTAGDSVEAQAEALLEAGVDALLLETHRADQAEAALARLVRTAGVPVLASLWDWPGDVSEAARRLAGLGTAGLGVNCVPGPAPALAALGRIRAATDLPLLAKPNAGPPGVPAIGPAGFAAAVPALLALGVGLIGGCCGTTDAHVRAIRAAVDGEGPRRRGG